MALRREVVSNYPVEAYIEPTSFCNLRCPACPTGLRVEERPSKSIDTRLFQAAIDEIGDYVFRLWMYNWGEPLLHKQTPELIRYAKQKDLKILLSSNLSIPLTDDYIDRLVGSGLDTLIVSLDGTSKETYEKYRLNGEFELVRKNMLRIRDAKKRVGTETPHVIWQFLVFRHNEHEIEEAMSSYHDWGADSIKVASAEMPLPPYDKGFEPSTLPQYNMYDTDNALMRESEKQMTGGRPCSWLYGTFVLNPNGKVSPCCGTSSEQNDFGDYESGGFFKIWNSVKFKQARRLFKGNGIGNLNDEQKREISRRIDGMAMRVNHSLQVNELICHKCPIPFRQDDVTQTILSIAYDVAHTMMHAPSMSERARAVMAYALMGVPHWRQLAKDAYGKIFHKNPPKLANGPAR